jgi:hypothetical protein
MNICCSFRFIDGFANAGNAMGKLRRWGSIRLNIWLRQIPLAWVFLSL